jgi:hypothetical protein
LQEIIRNQERRIPPQGMDFCEFRETVDPEKSTARRGK